MSDIYFGNNPEPDPIEIDGGWYWRMYTQLPGTAPENACGEDELDIPCDQFNKPETMGPGCDPVTMRYVSKRKQPAPQQQEPCPPTEQQPIKPSWVEQEPPTKENPKKRKGSETKATAD